MKGALCILLLVTSVISQDILQGKVETYKAKVVAIDSSYIAVIMEGKELISIAPHRVFTNVVLDSGEMIIKNNQLQIDSDHPLWYSGTKYLSGKRYFPLENESKFVSDQPKTTLSGLDPSIFETKEKLSLSSLQVGGILLALSGGLGLYLQNSEYDGQVFNIDNSTGEFKGYSEDYQTWVDTQKLIGNVRYVSLGLGGIMIAINIEF